MRFNATTTINTFVVGMHSVWGNRRAILAFTYRFGKNGAQQQNKKPTAADEEQNRVKGEGGQQ